MSGTSLLRGLEGAADFQPGDVVPGVCSEECGAKYTFLSGFEQVI